MKFLLFRILLLYRTKDRGFTLPMVIGIGLIMILLSSISLLQSSEENLTSISKTQSSTSFAMAELGIARYRELLDNNRFLAVNNLDNWTTVANQVCDDITDVPGDVDGDGEDDGWANNSDTTGWRPIEFNETTPSDETAFTPSIDLNNDGDTTDTNVLIDFNSDGDTADTNVEIGSYRLVNYIYQNDANPGVNGDFGQISDEENTGNPRGILTVQGRDMNSNSVSQVQVTIPLGVNTNDLQSLDPGIWINRGDEAGINFGNLDFPTGNGNLVLYKNANGCDDVDVTAGTTITAIRDPRDLPPLVTLPPNHNDLPAGDIGDHPDFDDNELILPETSDIFISNGDFDYYYYEVDGNLDIPDRARLLSDGVAKVIMVVDGDLNIVSDSDDPLIRTQVTNSSEDATSSYFEIHVTGDVNISGTGTMDLKALIHAPNGRVNLTGNPTVELTGSIWANDWDSVGTVNVTSSDYQFYSITPQRTPRPLTYAATGWEQQEAE